MARIKRALISVSDKQNILEFAAALVAMGIELLSTGGTARMLRDAGLTVTDVSQYTGFPEIMGGRVKTLHPKVAGALLGRTETDGQVMREHGIEPIDLLVVNLYPFEQSIARSNCTIDEAIENIDIGGPSMLRAAAKNHERVTVVVSNTDYKRVLDELGANNGETTLRTRRELALKVFEHTAAYDAAISNYLSGEIGQADEQPKQDGFPDRLRLFFDKREDMRYGENPHQRAAFYTQSPLIQACIATARQLNGKALSYNNVADADAALECVKSFAQPACVVVKHANPCGVAIAEDSFTAYARAFSTDPTSAFGGIIAFNRALDARTARAIIERQFVEVIVAPEVDDAAAAIVREKDNVRLLACGIWPQARPSMLDYKRVTGGLLVQDADFGTIAAEDLKCVSRRQPEGSELADLLFAFKVAKYVKSNAIVYARDGMTIGIGAGQMSRVYSARIGVIKAEDEGLKITGSVLASDAFFPFRDGIDAAAQAGVVAVIQPGGSVRDGEVIAAADEHNMAMVFTGMRHFRH